MCNSINPQSNIQYNESVVFFCKLKRIYSFLYPSLRNNFIHSQSKQPLHSFHSSKIAFNFFFFSGTADDITGVHFFYNRNIRKRNPNTHTQSHSHSSTSHCVTPTPFPPRWHLPPLLPHIHLRYHVMVSHGLYNVWISALSLLPLSAKKSRKKSVLRRPKNKSFFADRWKKCGEEKIFPYQVASRSSFEFRSLCLFPLFFCISLMSVWCGCIWNSFLELGKKILGTLSPFYA